MSNFCPDCGIQLLPDGTVDALEGGPDTHYLGCAIGQCIGRRRVAGQAKTVRCYERVIPGTRLCEVCSPGMCEKHPAYEADYCPGCGTATKI